MYNSIELFLNNALDHTTRVKFAQAILFAQAIIDDSWSQETGEYGEYTLSRNLAAIIARKKFDLPKYLESVLNDLLHNYWNEGKEFANSTLFNKH